MLFHLLFGYYDKKKGQYINPLNNLVRGLFGVDPFILFFVFILLYLYLKDYTKYNHNLQHTHHYYGITSCSDFHFHDCEGRTLHGLEHRLGHIHKLIDVKMKNPRHSHKILEITTGPEIPYENGRHYHEFFKTTSFINSHQHYLAGETSLM